MTHPKPKPKPKRTKYAGRAQDCMRVSLTPAPGRFQIRSLTGLVAKNRRLPDRRRTAVYYRGDRALSR